MAGLNSFWQRSVNRQRTSIPSYAEPEHYPNLFEALDDRHLFH
jgi:hypothetical protein